MAIWKNDTDSSRWYRGGRIYRNAWLVKTEPVHIAHWGTWVTTPKVSRTSGMRLRTVQVFSYPGCSHSM